MFPEPTELPIFCYQTNFPLLLSPLLTKSQEDAPANANSKGSLLKVSSIGDRHGAMKEGSRTFKNLMGVAMGLISVFVIQHVFRHY